MHKQKNRCIKLSQIDYDIRPGKSRIGKYLSVNKIMDMNNVEHRGLFKIHKIDKKLDVDCRPVELIVLRNMSTSGFFDYFSIIV